MRIPEHLKDDYPEERPYQCIHLRNICNCGQRFKPSDFVCKYCGEKRTRCLKTAMDGEDSCRSHVKGRPLTVYSALAGKVGDMTMEELVESADGNDVTGEFALAKAALANVIGDIQSGVQVNNEALLANIQTFFKIATDYKKFVTGDVLNIKMDDQVLVAVRRKFRAFVKALDEALQEFIQDDEIRIKVMDKVKDSAKTLGNSISYGNVNSRV